MGKSMSFKMMNIIALSLFILVGCASRHLIMIHNETDYKLIFLGEFKSEGGGYHNLEFELLPGESDGWFYEQSIMAGNRLYERLQKITLSHPSGCSVELDRQRIAKLLDGGSQIMVNNEMMACE
ncbi:hypothetical protein [Photobacterium nomapromontoriensis]|uniref:hypothetical protein n=1 Tax=Photobacterium nomapromontoriensis TaxID=2910237 RepID=UPI003D0D80F6